jgi:hypothetical protein
MPKMSSIEERLTILERQMREESTLRANQDGDLSGLTQSLRAANNLLQALALTQSDQTAALTEHTRTLETHSQQFASVQAKLDLIVEMLRSIAGESETGSGTPGS